ncbi:MAG TPA: hypothetical protein VNT81_05835 [Vicinamibacterales bacterium]|nr:hypothetical protein [Vicinamibacterales bacterium]
MVGEIAIRVADGYSLTSIRLARSAAEEREMALDADQQYVAGLALAAGVQPEWYDLNPPPLPRFEENPEFTARVNQYPADPLGALFVWNTAYLKRELCAGNAAGSLGILSEFYTFDPPRPGPYPIYRHLANASPPGWFVSNRFGWRGPDVTLEKPSGTIRIAFVGASTTVSAYAAPHSHPEFIGYWLNRWAEARGLSVRFEVINAGRTGIDVDSIAAIVEQEVAPVSPDLVIYYEGANSFPVGKALGPAPDASAVPKVEPTVTFRQRWAGEAYLATAARVLTAIDLLTNKSGTEPPKPAHPTVWPERVNESNPDIAAPLPIDLDRVVQGLDRMRQALAPAGGELATSSFIWLVHDGMRLDMERDITIFRYLNEMYWPASYAHMRRMADFQNRVFATYADRHGLPFFDVARDFPADPRLFGDAIHMREPGLRLLAWIYLQQLVPLIEARIASGQWPRQSTFTPDYDPATVKPRLTRRQDLLANCS